MNTFNLHTKNKWFAICALIILSLIGNNCLAQKTLKVENSEQINSFKDENLLYSVNIGDADLAVRYRKGIGTPIVFIHGSWDDHQSWLPVAQQMYSHLKNPIIVYDRRGHGASTPDTEQGAISKDVNDVLLLIKVLGFEKAHFIGHSYGANIAIQLVTQNPKKAESLVLYEPPIFGLLKEKPEYKEEMETIKTAMTTAKLLLEKGDIEKGAIHFIENVAFGSGSWKNLFDERARSTMLANYRTWLDQSYDPERLNIQAMKLNQFTGKILTISGSASLPVYPAVIKELKKEVKSIQSKTINGAGHGGLLSHSGETADMLIKHFMK